MSKMISEMVKLNRAMFLEALRSGNFIKGTINTDAQGRPILLSVKDEGYCAVGLLDHLLNPTYTSPGRTDSIGLSSQQIKKIQQEWNDSSLTFPQIADLIEYEMF